MDKNAREKLPGVLALLMGMLGMTLTTVMCYLTYSDISPRDVAIKAGTAWGVMLVVGFVVGSIATRFMPETAARGKLPEEKKAESKEEGRTSALNEGGINEMDALNILLNDPHPEMPARPPAGPAAGATSASISAPPAG